MVSVWAAFFPVKLSTNTFFSTVLISKHWTAGQNVNLTAITDRVLLFKSWEPWIRKRTQTTPQSPSLYCTIHKAWYANM